MCPRQGRRATPIWPGIGPFINNLLRLATYDSCDKLSLGYLVAVTIHSSGKQRAARRYEENKARALSIDRRVRADLAAREDVEPEILYYLADDNSGDVRKNLAINPATPARANLILATDDDIEVRMELARKICRLLPDITDQQAVALLQRTIEVLEILARDQTAAVRAIVAEALKDSLDVPKSIVMTLARDVEEIVACPILEYSPLLSDNDLLEIMASGIAAGGLQGIARRQNIGEEVSDVLVAQLEMPVMSALLANPSAKIREETLDRIIDQAETVEALHEPLVMRLNLSLRAMRRIAGFVAFSLVETLARRHNLPEQAEKQLKAIVRGRIDETREFDKTPKAKGRAAAEKLYADAKLDEDAVSEAVEARDQEFVTAALALLADFSHEKVSAMLSSRSGKIATSLCWRAGLGMRLAYKIQTMIAFVPGKDLVNARNGFDYPYSPGEMEWQLSFYEN